jgi:CelD/BcsL family acetyltransferase involved in cellulose biosynthesis
MNPIDPDEPPPDVRVLTFAQLDARSARFDALAGQTPEVDLFCSSSDWVLPARAAFAPGARPFVVESPDGFVALMAVPTVEGGRALLPLEASWGLASPFVGSAPEPLVETLFGLMGEGEPPADALFLSGLAVDGRTFRAVEAAVARSRRWLLYEGPTAGRHCADIRGGLEAFYARRSAGFRANARRARRQAQAAGVTYEHVTAVPSPAGVVALYERIQAVERRCWKGLEGHGIDQEPARSFYRYMLHRLARRGALRVIFARRDERDVAYVFGGLLAGTYRGLQCSFDEDFRPLSPGVLVHLEMIEALAAEGIALYDLGSEMEYKRRWGEEGLTTTTAVVIRSH